MPATRMDARPTLRKRNDLRELRFHRSVVELLEINYRHVLWWHTPNEREDETERKKLAGMGIRTGVFDLTFIVPPAGRACFLELKSPGEGLSPQQKIFRDDAIVRGCRVAIAESLDDVKFILAEWGIQPKCTFRFDGKVA